MLQEIESDEQKTKTNPDLFPLNAGFAGKYKMRGLYEKEVSLP
jgi:hypothetical protein